MSSLANMIIISAMLLHRYIKFKNQDVDGFTKHIRLYLVVSMGIGVICVVPITWELWETYTRSSIQCNTKVVKSGAFMGSTIVITMIIVFSSITIHLTTKRMKAIIKAGDERANQVLQMKRRTNTARIEATRFLWYLFFIGWAPYGVSRLFVFTRPTHQVHQTVGAICHALSTLVFSAIPIAFYKMDGKFAGFFGNMFATHQEVAAHKKEVPKKKDSDSKDPEKKEIKDINLNRNIRLGRIRGTLVHFLCAFEGSNQKSLSYIHSFYTFESPLK